MQFLFWNFVWGKEKSSLRKGKNRGKRIVEKDFFCSSSSLLFFSQEKRRNIKEEERRKGKWKERKLKRKREADEKEKEKNSFFSSSIVAFYPSSFPLFCLSNLSSPLTPEGKVKKKEEGEDLPNLRPSILKEKTASFYSERTKKKKNKKEKRY